MVSRLRCIGAVALWMMVMAAGSSLGSPEAQARSGTWAPAGSMAQARTGASAALLQDGTILIAGGEGSGAPGNTLEIFNPATGSFSLAGTLTSSRKNHAAVLLSDGRVMIVGGSDGNQILNSSEIVDPAAGTVSSGPSLSPARAGHSATMLLNGDVLVAGGSDGSKDLASAKLYSSSARTPGFAATANMLSPRSSHSAFLLPHNSAVLMVGGSSASAELYQAWNSAFVATGSPATPRSGAAGTPLVADGLLLLAGGGTPTAELYSFPTIKTDKDDYIPDERAIISGAGWAPGEAVTLVFTEVPKRHPDQFLKLTADASGNLYYDQWAPERHDLGIRFYVTAIGSQSGSQAQMTFTDGDITWTGNVSTDWSTAGNWSTNSVPAATDKAIIPAGRARYPVLSGTKKSVGSLQIDSGASLTVSGDLNLSKTASSSDSVVISGTLDWTSGAMTLAGSNVSLTVNSGGLFSVGSGTNGLPAFASISLDANSTVEYGGSNQTITTTTYGHLKLSGSGTKTWTGSDITISGNLDVTDNSDLILGGNLTVYGNLAIAAGTTLDVSSQSWNITLKGNWTNNGTFNPRGGGATVTLNGSTAQQTIGGTTASTFINLVISNTSGYGIRLSQNVTVNAGLALSNGIVDAATDGKTLTAALSVSGGNDSSYVSGKLARPYATATSKAFPIGKGGFYRPVTIAITQLNGNSTLTAEQFETNIPGGSVPGTSLLGPRYWHVTQDGAFGNQIYYTITLDGRGLITPTKQVKIIKRSATAESLNAQVSG